jgi:hypothetical protein
MARKQTHIKPVEDVRNLVTWALANHGVRPVTVAVAAFNNERSNFSVVSPERDTLANPTQRRQKESKRLHVPYSIHVANDERHKAMEYHDQCAWLHRLGSFAIVIFVERCRKLRRGHGRVHACDDSRRRRTGGIGRGRRGRNANVARRVR